MIRVLVVDDEQTKIQAISAALVAVPGVKDEYLFYANNVHSAKKEIAARRFDLIILDINLPRRADQMPEANAGLDVLSFIKNNDRAIRPAYIVGMTAYNDSAQSAAAAFSSPLWKLVNYSASDDAWREPLQSAMAYILAKANPPYATDGSTYHTGLGIVVALDRVELEAIRALPAGWRDVGIEFDAISYLRGSFHRDEASLDVVAVAAPRMGMPAAAVTTAKLIETFRPRVVAMAGICAGVRGKTQLGDILVADPCFDWGSGKWVTPAKAASFQFQPAAYQWRICQSHRSAIKKLGNDAEFLESIHRSFVGTKPDRPPRVLVDPMASGGSVLQDAAWIARILAQHKDLIGVEMEAYGVFTAAEYASDPKPTCLSIKSVCDFGDADKADGYQAYAAFTSAQFLYELSRRHLAEEPD